MIRTENDYFDCTHKGRFTPKDFQALIPPNFSYKPTYDSAHRPKFNASLFVVDWQLRVEDDSETPDWLL